MVDIKKKNLKFILYTIIYLVLASCIDQIDLHIPNNESDYIVIHGNLEKLDTTILTVTITNSVNYNSFGIPEYEDVNSVTLFEENGPSWNIDRVSQGIYSLKDIALNTGSKYWIEVETSRNELYKSDLEELLPAISPDSLSVKLIEKIETNDYGNVIYNQYLRLFINTPLKVDSQDKRACFKWGFNGVYKMTEFAPRGPGTIKECYVDQPLGNDDVYIFNGNHATGDYLGNYEFFEILVNYKFSLGFYFTLDQERITETAYNYWYTVGESITRTGSLTEPLPGNIASNIHKVSSEGREVIGCFSAFEKSTYYFYISPDDADFPLQNCAGLTYRNSPDYCKDCLLWSGSTLTKPDYWK